MQYRSSSVLIAALTLSAGVALAHNYDSNKPITLTGKVAEIKWEEPYVKIHLQVQDTNGKKKDWEIETAKPGVVESDGLTRTAIKEGDQITVQGSQEADGSEHALARSITMADGRTVAMNAQQNAPQQQVGGGPAPRTASDPGLPQTATNWPLFGVIGLMGLAAAGALSMVRRRLN